MNELVPMFAELKTGEWLGTKYLYNKYGDNALVALDVLHSAGVIRSMTHESTNEEWFQWI
jgi:hypothetical protein